MSQRTARIFFCLSLPLAVLTLIRCYALGGLFLPLCFLGLGLLAILFLRREGYESSSIAATLFPLVLAFFLRSLLLPHVTLDYQDFLSQWVEYFRQNGGVFALSDPIGNYNVPYLYFLAFLSYLPISDLYGIKLFSILFDVLLAWGGLRLVKILSRDKSAALTAFLVLLLLPTVWLNSACWAQCDSIWAAFCVHALAAALEEKPKTSLSLLALAFAFKLQAIFVIPLWCALWFTGRIKLRHFPVFPAVFVLTMVPALLFGKPVNDILSVYLSQAGDSVSWQVLNYNSPSIFALVPWRMQLPQTTAKIAILLAFLFMAAVLLLLFWKRKTASNFTLTLVGAALSLGIPFFLPYMHERYFFLGGVLLCILACVLPGFLTAGATAAELASLGGYHAYLLERYAITITLFGTVWTQLLEGLLMLLALGTVSVALFRLCRSKAKNYE